MAKPSIIYSEFTGLRSDRPIERFEHGDLVVSNNTDIDNSGMAALRLGRTKLLAGSFHSWWTDGNALGLLVTGGVLNLVNANYSLTALRTLTNAAAYISYTNINNRVYWSNGTDSGIIENGVCRAWGTGVAPLPGVSVTVGNMFAGTYQYSMNYTMIDGQVSGAPALNGTITVPDGSGLLFTLAVPSDARVATQDIYLSAPNGKDLFLALSVAATTLGTSYQNDTTELGYDLKTQFMSAPPAGQTSVYYRGHLFVAVGNRLYMSEEFAYELFDLRKSWLMDGRITGLAAISDKERMAGSGGMESGLFVGTDKSVGAMIGHDPYSMQYVKLSDYAMIEGSITYVDASLYGDDSQGARMLPIWATTQGIQVGLDQMEVKNISRTRYGFTASGKGAALFMPEANKLIFTSHF